MNRLRYETSPYLLQHAGNPVDWYAWKPEAFEAARTQDKPILVSIGYSTCHWCHVMERESFEDEEVAALMNRHFINIKVDREERPDVDQIYMEACQALSGSGGWPLNCFLTPDGRPFYAGTYYPPQPAYNRPSWPQLLQHIAHAFENEREKVEKQAQRLTESIERSDSIFISEESLAGQGTEDQAGPADLQAIFQRLQGQFDNTHGGFGGAPKFPGTLSLEFLLDYAHYLDEAAALRHVIFSLEKMIRGGIYDQLGGGFARYATDKAWLIPHFEKMLYDNALLVRLLARVYQRTGNRLFRETIGETLTFIQREMSMPEGAFYTALDADSEGREGKFYLWDRSEIEQLLGEEAPLFCEFYGVTETGNWEGHNILWRKRSLEEFAAVKKMDAEALRPRFVENRQTLFRHRSRRIRPALDDKVLLGWNALMAGACAEAGAALGEERYIRTARQNVDFLLQHMVRPDGGLWRVFKEGKTQYEAFLDDYAFLTEALLRVYQVTFEARYLDRALALTDYVIQHFLDADTRLFFYTSDRQQDVIVRKKELYDSATPSGNATMVHNLLQLGLIFDKPEYRELALGMVQRMRESVVKYPSSFAYWAQALTRLVFPAAEIAVIGPRSADMARRIQQLFIPNKVIMANEEADDRYPLLAGKAAAPQTQVFICRQYACQRPVTTLEEVEKMVNEST